jgi:hypothetical protein
VPQPPPTPGLIRANNIIILGVHVDNNLSMQLHVQDVLSSCSQSLYALRMLKNSGLDPFKLLQVFQATVLSKILYAAPAWTGYLNVNLWNRLEAFISKSKRFGYCSEDLPSLKTLCSISDDKLFTSITSNPRHVLYSQLPDTKVITYNLRTRVHNYVLPDKDERNFLSRMLFKDIY